MQVCTSLQTDNHASTPPLKFFTDRMPFLPPNQQCQSTEGEKTVRKLPFKVAFYFCNIKRTQWQWQMFDKNTCRIWQYSNDHITWQKKSTNNKCEMLANVLLLMTTPMCLFDAVRLLSTNDKWNMKQSEQFCHIFSNLPWDLCGHRCNL